MSKMSREKGKRFERTVANLFKKHGYAGAHRSAQYCGNTGDAADVIGEWLDISSTPYERWLLKKYVQHTGFAELYPYFLLCIDSTTDLSDEFQLTDMIAISQSTPGPIGINMATYAGFKAAGIGGAFVATLSEVLPAMIIIYFVAKILNKCY